MRVVCFCCATFIALGRFRRIAFAEVVVVTSLAEGSKGLGMRGRPSVAWDLNVAEFVARGGGGSKEERHGKQKRTAENENRWSACENQLNKALPFIKRSHG